LSDTSDLTEFFYLTTIGRKSGKPHQIEIWYVEHDGCYYVVAETRDHADWVRNIVHNPAVTYSVGSSRAAQLPATARPVDPAREPELAAAVSALMDAAYEWSDGLIVEVKPGSR
jgi:deazaflavin-dependent oxidoreductase (nitroreductase family)